MRTERKHRHRRRFYVRQRAAYLIAVIVVMGLGLASRSDSDRLPNFLAEHAGDALWAAMVYLLIRLLFPRSRLAWCALGAALFSFGIECSQLYHADWIEQLRATTLGALVLGRGFVPLDFLRYSVGIAIAWGIDIGVCTFYAKRVQKQEDKR